MEAAVFNLQRVLKHSLKFTMLSKSTVIRDESLKSKVQRRMAVWFRNALEQIYPVVPEVH